MHIARSELFAIEYIPDKRYVVFAPFNGYRIRGSNQSIILRSDQLGDRGIVIRRQTIALGETGLNTDTIVFKLRIYLKRNSPFVPLSGTARISASIQRVLLI